MSTSYIQAASQFAKSNHLLENSLLLNGMFHVEHLNKGANKRKHWQPSMLSVFL
jgi:hypothetical protein